MTLSVETGRDRREISRALARFMRQVSSEKRHTKRSAARLAIVEAIRTEVLAPGEYLPSETSLTEILGVSLGTVQAALRQLQQVGAIVRRRGDGTRVASTEPLTPNVWHFRFVSKDTGNALRILREKVWIDRIQETGDWSDYLGGEPDYVRIRRRVIMHDRTPAGAEMFVRADAVPGLENVHPRELDMVNIRPYIEELYGLASAGASHLVRSVTLDANTAAIFDLDEGMDVFEVRAKAHASDLTPVYFQRIFVSLEACELSF